MSPKTSQPQTRMMENLVLVLRSRPSWTPRLVRIKFVPHHACTPGRAARRHHHHGHRCHDYGNCIHCCTYSMPPAQASAPAHALSRCAAQGVNEAYDELNNSVNDLESVVANWESRPVIDIMRAASNASPECPSGFSVLSGLSWPGADSLGWYVLTLSLRRQWCPLRARRSMRPHTHSQLLDVYAVRAHRVQGRRTTRRPSRAADSSAIATRPLQTA